jgi:hypothetical protein
MFPLATTAAVAVKPGMELPGIDLKAALTTIDDDR